MASGAEAGGGRAGVRKVRSRRALWTWDGWSFSFHPSLMAGGGGGGVGWREGEPGWLDAVRPRTRVTSGRGQLGYVWQVDCGRGAWGGLLVHGSSRCLGQGGRGLLVAVVRPQPDTGWLRLQGEGRQSFKVLGGLWFRSFPGDQWAP